MREFLALLFLALVYSSPAQAIVFEVRGYNEVLLYKQSYPMGDRINAGRATMDFLKFGARTGRITFEGSREGIRSINSLGSKVEESGGEIRAYGWCYAVDGVVPNEMANRVYIPSDMSRLVWFYAYGRSVDGEWQEQCVPAVK